MNLNRVSPYLAELEQLSKQRLATNVDFAYIREDIADFLKEQADKSISLNEAGRLAEQKTRQERAEARRKERLSRKKSEEKVFDLTLKNVDLAQLQPVAVKTNSIAGAGESIFNDTVGEVGAEAGDGDSSSDDTSELDPTLAEARHILADYVSIMNKEPIISKAP